MLALLLAFQLSTTNCQSNYTGGLNCTTMDLSTPQPSTGYVSTDWAAIFAKIRENRRAKAVGQMLVNGDCAGAERYALARGDFDLVQTVRAYCAQARPALVQTPVQAPTSTVAIAAGPHKVRAKTPSGYCLDVPPDYVGTGAENSPAVTTGMPRCDQLSVKEDSPLRLYRH